MASLQFDEASGRYRIRFYFGGEEFKRSIKTTNQKTALGIQARVEETIRLLEQGRLEIPVGADPAAFILSDGKLTAKPVAHRAVTLADLFATYREKYPAGAKESSTAYTERTLDRRLYRRGRPRQPRDNRSAHGFDFSQFRREHLIGRLDALRRKFPAGRHASRLRAFLQPTEFCLYGFHSANQISQGDGSLVGTASPAHKKIHASPHPPLGGQNRPAGWIGESSIKTVFHAGVPAISCAHTQLLKNLCAGRMRGKHPPAFVLVSLHSSPCPRFTGGGLGHWAVRALPAWQLSSL